MKTLALIFSLALSACATDPPRDDIKRIFDEAKTAPAGGHEGYLP